VTAGYRRVRPSERSLHEGTLGEALSGLRGFLPLSVKTFENRLAAGLETARRAGTGFYLGGFAGRRALGNALVINVDPRLIELRLQHRAAEADRVYLIRDRFLGAGDWTALLSGVRNSSTYKEVQEIIEAGLDYRKTEAYRTALQRAGGPRPVSRNFVALRSPELVERYFSQTAELCRSIRDHGLQRRAHYGRRMGESLRNPRVRLPWVELGESEVGIAIGAGGEIYRFASGKHRTAVAQALGLDSMPGEIRMVHATWLDRQMANSGLSVVEALLRGVRALERSG
jgi:hypothetical protein